VAAVETGTMPFMAERSFAGLSAGDSVVAEAVVKAA
jgi:hypothetical protein